MNDAERRSDELADQDLQHRLPLDVPDQGGQQVEHDRQTHEGD